MSIDGHSQSSQADAIGNSWNSSHSQTMQMSNDTLNIKSEFSPSRSEGYFAPQNVSRSPTGDTGYFKEQDASHINHFGTEDQIEWQHQYQQYPSVNMNVKISTTPWKSRANQSQGNRRAKLNTNTQSQARNALKIDTPGAIGNNNVQYYLSNRAKTKSRRPSQLFACNFCGKMFTTSSGLYGLHYAKRSLMS